MNPWNETTAVVNKCNKLKLFTVGTIKLQSHNLDNLNRILFHGTGDQVGWLAIYLGNGHLSIELLQDRGVTT